MPSNESTFFGSFFSSEASRLSTFFASSSRGSNSGLMSRFPSSSRTSLLLFTCSRVISCSVVRSSRLILKFVISFANVTLLPPSLNSAERNLLKIQMLLKMSAGFCTTEWVCRLKYYTRGGITEHMYYTNHGFRKPKNYREISPNSTKNVEFLPCQELQLGDSHSCPIL